jgi:hypothetical protein
VKVDIPFLLIRVKLLIKSKEILEKILSIDKKLVSLPTDKRK